MTLLMVEAQPGDAESSAEQPRVNLGGTVTARWRNRLTGLRPDQRRHWHTKVSYYAAVARLLGKGIHQPTWSDVIREVRPRGSRSTFYEVAGAHAKHSLIGDLIAHASSESMQLALYYRRNSAVGQLIDEVKVWTYWPYRERLAIQYQTRPALDVRTSVDMLFRTVDSWARHAQVAAALTYAPPVCAVEDLLLLRPGHCSAVHAASVLTDVIRNATSRR